MTPFAKPFVLAAASAGLLLLSACGDEPETVEAETATSEDMSRTLAAALGDRPDMATLNGAISTAELGSLFDGPGSYTLLAPNDGAFSALGDRAGDLMEEPQRPLLVALLRDHILPGHLTPENIEAAIEAQDGEVRMTTLGGGEVTFARDGDALVVTSAGGSSASIPGSAQAASNGVIIPLDAVLVPEETAAN